MTLPIELAAAPWSLLMAFASLGLIYALFRQRPDVFEDIGLTGKEVALLCLGCIAGWAANLPLQLAGGTYIAVNFGGTLVPLLLIGWWVAKRKLRIWATLGGTALVALVAWRIVEFSPEQGIVSRYPDFFLPVLVAIVYGLLISLHRIKTSAHVAYASGTLGALIGADLLHMRDIQLYFASAPENTIISIGGAGVFDMVFLAGTFAMATNLAVIVALASRKPRVVPERSYPHRPVHIEDGGRLYRKYQTLHAPNALERALAGLALSDIALRQGEYTRSVRLSWLAVDSLLADGKVRNYVGNGVDARLLSDVDALRSVFAAARMEARSLRDAGEANITAKTLVAALAPKTGLTHQLEGVT